VKRESKESLEPREFRVKPVFRELLEQKESKEKPVFKV
jgi:hypothetical protein